jgi:hypothetical protein
MDLDKTIFGGHVVPSSLAHIYELADKVKHKMVCACWQSSYHSTDLKNYRRQMLNLPLVHVITRPLDMMILQHLLP